MWDAHRTQLATTGTVTFTVRARPNAKTTECTERLEDGSMKIDLHAAPEDNEANVVLVKFLAKTFDVPLNSVVLLSGHTGRRKLVRITR